MKKQKESRVSDLFEIAEAMSPDRPYVNILEWLYTHDGAYFSRAEWRSELLKIIKENL